MKSQSIEIILKVVHELVDQQCGRNGPVQEDYVPDHWSDGDQFNSFCSKINQLIVKNIDYKHGQVLKVTDDLPEDVEKSILEALEIRRAEIKSSLIGQIICSPSSIVMTTPTTINLPLAIMSDFDWQVKLALASNLLSEINEFLINLDLLVIKPNRDSNGRPATIEDSMTSLSLSNSSLPSDHEEVKSIEMDKTEVRKLIEKLEDLMDKLDH